MFSIIEHSGAHSERDCLRGCLFTDSHRRLPVHWKLGSFPSFPPLWKYCPPFCLAKAFLLLKLLRPSLWSTGDSMVHLQGAEFDKESRKLRTRDFCAITFLLFVCFFQFLLPDRQKPNLNFPFPIWWCRERKYEFADLECIRPILSDLNYPRISLLDFYLSPSFLLCTSEKRNLRMTTQITFPRPLRRPHTVLAILVT